METLETLETRGNMEGNTKISRVVPGLYWCFTLNNWSKEELETLETNFKKEEIEYIFSEEIGESGTPHLQGFIKSKKKIRPNEKFGNKRIHWEKCKGNEIQNTNYVTKSDGVTHTNMRIIKDVIKLNGAYPWQQEICDICETEPDDRTIHWYWDKKGNKGKTSLAKHLYLKYGKKMIFVNGKASDVKCAIAQCETKPEIIIFGIPRSCQDYMGSTYGALEEVKDGIFFSGKYESGMVVYPTPHVFVFANFAPDKKSLSKDRWNIVNIGNEEDSSDEETDTFGLD